MQLERRPQLVDDGSSTTRCDGQQLGKATEWGDPAHASSRRNGLVKRSMPDRGRGTVSRIDHGVVGHRQDHGLQRMQHLIHRATGQIDPADRTGEHEVSGEYQRLLVVVG